MAQLLYCCEEAAAAAAIYIPFSLVTEVLPIDIFTVVTVGPILHNQNTQHIMRNFHGLPTKTERHLRG
jgi:hypothetical protein